MAEQRSDGLIDLNDQNLNNQSEHQQSLLRLDRQPQQIDAGFDILDFDHHVHRVDNDMQQKQEANQQQRPQLKIIRKQENNEQFLQIVSRKGCICKKTKCLKMYCECFTSNVPCTDQCSCVNCSNTPEHHQQIEKAKLMIRDKGAVGLHNCNLSEKRCNCMKSKCQKKYCQCFNSGVLCTPACKCVECKNCDSLNNNEEQKKAEQINIEQKLEKTQIKKKQKKQKKQKQKKTTV